MEKLKIGDTVKLNSGGPTMTVCNVNDTMIECEWFDPSKDCVRTHEFRTSMLTKVKITEINVEL